MAERYSHPPENGHDGVFLRDHLDDVAERVRYVVPEDARTSAGDPLREIVETLAYVHDLGKATTFFQQHIDVVPGSPNDERYRYHAPLGAFAAYDALDSRGFDPETCLAGFVAVAKHHGRLPDVAAYVFETTHRRAHASGVDQNRAERNQVIVKLQVKDIHENVPDLADSVIESATAGAGSWHSFATSFDELVAEIESVVATSGRSPGITREALSETCYGLVLECWGALVLADKTSAAAPVDETPASETYAGEPPCASRLDEYVGDLEATARADPDGTRAERLNYFRARARKSVIENAAAFAEDGGGVATLTLPTGFGKTLSGLSAAFTVRDRLGHDRVIYALPFTSIIDQVVDEVAEIYETNVTGQLLTAHHHLSETTMQRKPGADDESADLDDDIAGMLAESWRAGLTVTTFVQLFESLAGPTNRQAMKLPALRDSVIVLDEPQSLPLRWWKLVQRLITLLTEQYGASVIAMTATQPQLFEDPVELVDDPDSYFEATNRVTYELDPSALRYVREQSGPKSYDRAATALIDDIETGDSVLAICNTIDSAQTLSESVAERLPSVTDVGEVFGEILEEVGEADRVDPAAVADRVESSGQHALMYLSTRLRPADRLALIGVAKQLTDREGSFVTISTQLVEAGVDISFDRVYRDLAPIDSIVQAAGRCNRSFERDSGRVSIWWLDSPAEQERTPAEAVYNRGAILLPVAAETIESVQAGDGSLTETAVSRHAVERYYQTLHEEKNVGEAEYAAYVDEARGDKLAGLSLIGHKRSVDVLVCRTETDRDLVRSVHEAEEAYDFDALDRLLDESKPLTISVPVYRSDSDTARALGKLPPLLSSRSGFTNSILVLDTNQFGNWFNDSTGFTTPENTVEYQFI